MAGKFDFTNESSFGMQQSLRAALEEKRRREGEDCAARLEEARQRFRRSQERLKGLIREKEEKRDTAKRERDRC